MVNTTTSSMLTPIMVLLSWNPSCFTSRNLLSKLKYNTSTDHLIHVGDILAKGTLKGSLAVLDDFTRANVSGVRGNHDQKVIEWRAWFDWVKSSLNGVEWLTKVEKLSKKEWKSAGRIKHEFPVPDGWKWRSDHWEIARQMSYEHYQYLLRLPLVIHIPALHMHVVHAGLVPVDLKQSHDARHQPLSHIPKIRPTPSSLAPTAKHTSQTTIAQLRQAQV